MKSLRTILALVTLTAATTASAIDYIPDAAGSRFISSSVPGRVTLEFRDEAAIAGSAVKLKDIVRCSAADASALDLTLEIPVGKIPESGKLSLDVSEVKKALETHGISLLGIHFSGAAVCQVSGLYENLPSAPAPATKADQASKTDTASISSSIPSLMSLGNGDESRAQAKTLREIILQNISDRMGLDPDDIVLAFKTEDNKYANLSETNCRFSIAPNKLSNLGAASWDVTIKGPEGEKRVFINGTIQAWRSQIKVTKPLGFHQTITKDDVKESRILADRLVENLSLGQVLGSETTRALSPGDIIAPNNIQAGVLVRTGQFITVTVRRGSLAIKWVAEARQNGVYGDVIRVRKPGTRDEFMVRLTGKEQGDLLDGNEVAAR